MKPVVEFVISAAHPRQFPPEGPPEIAFLGRSNVGKSSLLNSLVGAKVAHVSSTPGRTQTINFFNVRFSEKRPEPELRLVDLPGYGYARVPRAIAAEWQRFIDPYLKERETLVLCVALVDANVPPQAIDAQMVEWLRKRGRRFVVVATKSDKLSGNQRGKALRALQEELEVETVLPFSARTGAGGEELWRVVREAAG